LGKQVGFDVLLEFCINYKIVIYIKKIKTFDFCLLSINKRNKSQQNSQQKNKKNIHTHIEINILSIFKIDIGTIAFHSIDTKSGSICGVGKVRFGRFF
jgi:hypothetical protein